MISRKQTLILSLASFSCFNSIAADALMNMTFKPYGILKAAYIAADGKTSSFDSGGVGAITQAGQVDETSAATIKRDKDWTHAFQSMQSRIGAKFGNGSEVSGQVEFDFVDFSDRQPSPDQNIRLRIAQLNYAISDNLMLSAGQKWVTWAGAVSPHTYNFVEGFYRAGNTGFILQEVSLKWTKDALQLYGAVGSKGRNTTATATDNDYGLLPQFTLRADFIKPNYVLGTAATYASLDSEAEAGTNVGVQNGSAYLVKGYGSVLLGGLDLRTEFYKAMNSNELFALGLNSANYNSNGSNVHTYGGYISGKYTTDSNVGFYAGYGMAKAKDGEKIASINGGGAGTSNNMIANSNLTVGLDKKTASGLNIYLESQNFKTEYKTSAGTNGTKKSYKATTFEAGMKYNF